MELSNRSLNITKAGIRSFSSSKIIYNLTVGQPDFEVPKLMKEAVKSAVDGNKNGYIKTGGVPEVRDELGQYISEKFSRLGKYNKDFGLTITSGVTGGLYCSILACSDIGDDILLADPYFSPYLDIIKLAGVNPVLIDTYPHFKMTAEMVKKGITPKTRALVLNSPSNPTGRTIEKYEMQKIVDLCHENDITIISDEIYADYAYDFPHTSVAELTDQAIILKGFSKSHGTTGWRIGYVCAPLEISNMIEKIQGKLYVSSPSITHYSIPAALKTDPLKYVSLFKERRNLAISLLKETFPDIQCDGGMFVFFDVSKSCSFSATDFVSKLTEKGVAILPGSVFSKKDTHCRISLTCETGKLFKALEIIKETVISYNQK